jgi:tetratricopeptide (TPR) repeat protein
MERFEPQLEIVAELDKDYRPPRPERHVWPLVKLRRYDEARVFAKLALESSDEKDRLYARTGLCNLEFESGTRMATYQACLDVTTAPEAKGDPNRVELQNAGEAAIAVLRFEEGERLYVRATKASDASIASPYQKLAELYISEGRVAEAVSAMRGAREQQLQSSPWMDQQKIGLLDGTLTELLLTAGEADRAAQIAERAVIRPDRHGLWSGTPEQAHAAEALRYATALRMRAEELEEDASSAGILESLELHARAAMDRLEVWRQRRRAGVLLSAEKFFIQSWRPYAQGRIDLLPWMVPEMVGAAGGGPSLAAIGRAREPDGWGGAYLDAYEAEAQLACGDARAAESAAERAIRDLPPAEVLLRARASAVSARAARELGDPGAEIARLSQVLAHDPSLFRRLGMTLPIAVRSDGSDVAEKAKRMVSSSPRFRSGAAAFVVTLAAGEACLLGPTGERLQCARPKLPDAPAEERARVLVRELHKVAFALNISLTQSDLNSLDGSPASGRAARQVDQLLGGMAP